MSKQLTKAEKEADLARRRGLVEVDGKVKPRSAVAFLTTHHPDSKKGKPTGVKHVVKRKSAIKQMAEEARVCAPRSPALHACMRMCVCVLSPAGTRRPRLPTPLLCWPIPSDNPSSLLCAAQGEGGQIQRLHQVSSSAFSP